MPDEPEVELSPATIAVIRDLFPAPPVLRDRCTDEELAALVTGTASPEEEEEIVAILTRSADCRARLIDYQREKLRLAAIPLGTWDTQATRYPSLLDRLRMATRTVLGAADDIRKWSLTHSWPEFVDFAPARASLGSVGQALRRLLEVPALATTRAPISDFQQEGYIPVGVDVRLDAEIRPDGALYARADFLERAPDAAAPLADRSLHLELIDPAGGTLPIGQGTIKDRVWEVEIPDFVDYCDLPEGGLPPGIFRLSVGNGPLITRQRNHLFAESPEQAPVSLPLVEEPRIEEETLIVTLQVPGMTRRSFGDCRLELSVPIGNALQLLGFWPLSDWEPEQRTLRIPLPGTAGGRIECGSILHARLARI